MGKYLKINYNDVYRLLKWFTTVTSVESDMDEDYKLSKRLRDFMDFEEEETEDGKRITESY